MEYKIGDTVLIRAKVEDVDFDEYGQICIVSLPRGELKAIDPEELVAEKAVEETEKASENPEKSSKNGANRNKTAEKEPKRQQEKAAGHKERHIPLPPGGHELAKELAELNK